MKNVIYTLIALVGIFLTLGESNTALTNVLGIIILFAVCAKVGIINIKDIWK